MTYNLIVPYIRSYVHLLKSSSNLTSNPEVNVVTLLLNMMFTRLRFLFFVQTPLQVPTRRVSMHY